MIRGRCFTDQEERWTAVLPLCNGRVYSGKNDIFPIGKRASDARRI